MSWISGILNGLRDGILTNEELQNRQEIRRSCAIVKIAAVAASVIAIAGAVFSLLTAGILWSCASLLLTGIAVTVLHDVYRTADNMLLIVDDFATEMICRIKKDHLKKHLCRGTIFATPLIGHILDRAVIL